MKALYKPIMIDEELADEIKMIFPELSYNRAVRLILKVFKESDYNRESPDIFTRLKRSAEGLPNDPAKIKAEKEQEKVEIV